MECVAKHKTYKKKNLQLILQPRNNGLSDFYIWQHIHKISDLHSSTQGVQKAR